jgi:hypothetical protein
MQVTRVRETVVVRAHMTLWNIPDVQPLSSSGAYIAVVNKEEGLEFIAAGVHVCHCIMLFILSFRLSIFIKKT